METEVRKASAFKIGDIVECISQEGCTVKCLGIKGRVKDIVPGSLLESSYANIILLEGEDEGYEIARYFYRIKLVQKDWD